MKAFCFLIFSRDTHRCALFKQEGTIINVADLGEQFATQSWYPEFALTGISSGNVGNESTSGIHIVDKSKLPTPQISTSSSNGPKVTSKSATTPKFATSRWKLNYSRGDLLNITDRRTSRVYLMSSVWPQSEARKIWTVQIIKCSTFPVLSHPKAWK